MEWQVSCGFPGMGTAAKLVLHRHGVGIDGLFTGDAFEAGEDAAVVVLVALHGEAALLVAILPGEADEVLL